MAVRSARGRAARLGEARRRATGARLVPRSVLGLALGLACGEPDPEPSGSTEGDTGTGAASGSEADASGSAGETTWTLPDAGPPTPQQTASCSRWVACAAELELEGLAELEAAYGIDGTCWDGDAAQAAACDGQCATELEATVMELRATGQPVPAACDPPAVVSWAQIEAILDANCVDACHEPGGEDPSLDLSGDAYYELYGVASSQSVLFFVTAGRHEDSYLWHKVNGSQGTAGGSGSRMPKDARPLTQEEIDAIADWIDGGAQPY